MPQKLVGQRYRLLRRLGAGGMGAVYEAEDRLERGVVALKLVRGPGQGSMGALPDEPPQDRDAPRLRERRLSRAETLPRLEGQGADRTVRRSEGKLSLAREFRILSTLRHPRVVGVLDYGFHGEHPYFTMELLRSPRTISEAGASEPPRERLRLFVQLLQALVFLHRHGIVHHDLKPENVLVCDREVKVVDFGLAELTRDAAPRSELSGTIPYLSPELLNGGRASQSSDLYAAGVMLFELCTGKHPFGSPSDRDFLQRVLLGEPRLEHDGIPALLRPPLARLLARSPESRYQTALDASQALCEALDLTPLEETTEMRESLLRAAPLVGRESEVSDISDAVDRVVRGEGGALLLAGESGVGKTRLLDEARTLALVAGAVVVSGQAVDQGGHPYDLWQPLARSLCLQGDLDDFEAGVLRPLARDVEWLLAREVPAVPALAPEASRQRMTAVLGRLLSRCAHPLVIVLDDLQWASEASLDLLRQTLEWTSELPILVLASYRNDERRDLGSKLERMQAMEIDRLSARHIAELSNSMLGADGQDSSLVQYLQRESEGNVFFLIEIVRAIRDRTGSLRRHLSTDRESLLTQGIQRLVDGRLSQAPDWGGELLQLAAIAGRRLDLQLLAVLEPTQDLDRWLRHCSEAAILEVRERDWRFAHDKLREAVIRKIPPERRCELYRRVARAVEELHDDQSQHVAALAHLWSRGCESNREDVTRRALESIEAAVDRALSDYDNDEALRLLAEAFQLAEGRPTSWHPSGPAGEPIELEDSRRARWEEQRGRATRALLRLSDSEKHLERSVRLLDRKVPHGRTGLAAALLGAACVQLLPRRTSRSSADRELNRDLSRLYGRMAEVYWFKRRPAHFLYSVLRGLNAAERVGLTRELGPSYAAMCMIAGVMGLSRLADRCAKRALEASDNLNDPATRATVLARLSLYYVGQGRWGDLDVTASQGIDICRRIGDESVLGDLVTFVANGAFLQARFKESLATWRELMDVSRRQPQFEPQALYGRALVHLRLGQVENALEFLDRAQDVLPDQANDNKRAIILALQAVAALRLGHRARSYRLSDAADRILGEKDTMNFTSHFAHASVVEVQLDRWRESSSRTPSSARDSKRAAQRAVQRLMSFARRFPIGLPQAYFSKALLLEASGRQRESRRSLERALSAAQRLHMPYEVALARLCLGKASLDATDSVSADDLRALRPDAEEDLLGVALSQRDVASSDGIVLP